MGALVSMTVNAINEAEDKLSAAYEYGEIKFSDYLLACSSLEQALDVLGS